MILLYPTVFKFVTEFNDVGVDSNKPHKLLGINNKRSNLYTEISFLFIAQFGKVGFNVRIDLFNSFVSVNFKDETIFSFVFLDHRNSFLLISFFLFLD